MNEMKGILGKDRRYDGSRRGFRGKGAGWGDLRFALLCVLLLFVTRPVGEGKLLAQSSSTDQPRPAIGFVDEDGDGVNDLFVDANGDGIDDVDGRPYPHHFQFRDDDGDGINDLWVDADGDGVNDLILKVEFPGKGPKWVDVDGDGIEDRDVSLLLPPGVLWRHVLDTDDDGKNDVTGVPYRTRFGILGFRYGKVDEETGQVFRKFIDKNRDGMHDKALQFGWARMRRRMDVFIDRDGDGIGDARKAGVRRTAGSRARMGRLRGGAGTP